MHSLIEFTTEWQLVPTTCEPCTACREIIYGTQYQLFIEPGGATDTNVCESCYMKFEKEDVT